MSEPILKPEERRKEVARMVEAGTPRQEIQQRLGIKPARLTQDILLARRAGLLPPFEPKRPPEESMSVRMQKGIARANVTGGTMFQVYGAMTAQVQDWLISQVPEGSSVADTVAAIVTDAYFEENPDA